MSSTRPESSPTEAPVEPEVVRADVPADAVDDPGAGPAADPAAEREAVEDDDVLLVDPARVRRAPRYKAFFTVGAVVGVVVGLALGLWATGIASGQDGGLMKPGVYLSVVVLGSTTFFVLLAGALAVWADRRSLRGR